MVEIVSSVAQGVDACQVAGGGNDVAVGVVLIAGHHCAAGIDQLHYIALEVGDVVVHGAVVLQGEGRSAGIVEEVQGVGAVGFPEQLAAGVVVGVGRAVDSLRGADTVVVIGIGDGMASTDGFGQIPAFRPGEFPLGAVVVAGGIAAAVVGNGLSIVSRQQIAPLGIAVGIAVAVGGFEIAKTVVGVGIGGVTRSFQKLALGIVGVGNDFAVRSGVGGNVAKGIIGIAVAGRAGQAAVADLADLGSGLGVRQVLYLIIRKNRHFCNIEID